ncbi:MAG: hypothetical protein QW091_02855 [Candidatus Micrarchaeaceae archaeon]
MASQMQNYDPEFLDYVQKKYHIDIDKATNGTERERITFAIAWNIWQQAKKVYSKKANSKK